MELISQIADKLQTGDKAGVVALVQQAIDQKLPTEQILNQGLVAGMGVIGEKFKVHEIFLPDVLLAAKAMLSGMELLKPLLITEGIPSLGKVVIGTVQGDLHDIGKTLVGIMLKGAGIEVIDLGKDVAPEKFIETAIAEKAQVIGLSALLTTTMPMMRRVVELAKEAGIYETTRIIIGGAPVTDKFAAEIGAHAYCYDGLNAVERVKAYVGVN